MDSFKSFRNGYGVLQTGVTKEIQVNTMFDLAKSETAVLIACTPQKLDGYDLMKKNNFGQFDRQYYEYRIQENPSWTILICGLSIESKELNELAVYQNQIANILNKKKDTLPMNILDID